MIDTSTIDSVLAYLKQEAEKFDVPPPVLLRGALAGVGRIREEAQQAALPAHWPDWVKSMNSSSQSQPGAT